MKYINYRNIKIIEIYILIYNNYAFKFLCWLSLMYKTYKTSFVFVLNIQLPNPLQLQTQHY